MTRLRHAFSPQKQWVGRVVLYLTVELVNDLTLDILVLIAVEVAYSAFDLVFGRAVSSNAVIILRLKVFLPEFALLIIKLFKMSLTLLDTCENY